MLPIRARIFPNIDIDIESPTIWVEALVRKKHTDGIYYLTQVMRSIIITPELEIHRNRLIHQMLNEFNYMVFMYLTFSPVKPEIMNIHGAPIFFRDPEQTDELERTFVTFS